MTLLGINCGYGNTDCKTLVFGDVDLDSGWLETLRHKTSVKRRAKLWPETVTALRDFIEFRPEPRSPNNAQVVFITRHGNTFGSPDDAYCTVSQEFKSLLHELSLYEKGRTSFYGLRHTFETVAGDAIDQAAVDYVMGHKDSSMASVYRHRIADSRLDAVADHVRAWLFG